MGSGTLGCRPGARRGRDYRQAGGRSRADPHGQENHFAAGVPGVSGRRLRKARALWREYTTRYPNDTKAGEAQYWIGASYTQQNKPATALRESRKVISDYAKNSAVNVALYGMADAFYRLHACTDAKRRCKR